MELERYAYSTADVPDITPEQRLAGGIYQTRHRMDAQYEEMNRRLDRIETALGV